MRIFWELIWWWACSIFHKKRYLKLQLEARLQSRQHFVSALCSLPCPGQGMIFSSVYPSTVHYYCTKYCVSYQAKIVHITVVICFEDTCYHLYKPTLYALLKNEKKKILHILWIGIDISRYTWCLSLLMFSFLQNNAYLLIIAVTSPEMFWCTTSNDHSIVWHLDTDKQSLMRHRWPIACHAMPWGYI